MTIQEHSVTLISIIVGLGLTEMFGNLQKLIRRRASVTWDWLPILWATILLVVVVNYWWGLYIGSTGLKQVSNAAQSGLLLVQPLLLFLAVASAIPNFEPDEDWDMHRHYGAQRKLFIGTFVVYQCLSWAVAFFTGTLGWNIASIARAMVLALLLVALALNRRRADWVIAGAILVILIVRMTRQVA